MLHITVTAKKAVNPEHDGLDRPYVGYEEGMSQAAMYEANHGEWAIGARAEKERYALFSFGRTVIQAVEIESLERTTIYSGDPNEKREDIVAFCANGEAYWFTTPLTEEAASMQFRDLVLALHPQARPQLTN